MNGALILVITIIVLVLGYIFYGRYLARKWGASDRNTTPAFLYEDDENPDYIPTERHIVFGHQFSSIAGVAPINGPIQAAVFGWIPVLLWCLIGGVFIGAMHDYAALFTSVRNKGRSIGYIIEQFLGKTGKRVFLIFVCLIAVLVSAAFADIVVQTFAVNSEMTYTTKLANARVGSTTLFFTFFAIAFGFLYKKLNIQSWIIKLIALVILVDCVAFGFILPIHLEAEVWTYILFAYLFLAAVLPAWLLILPRDYITSYLLLIVLAGAGIGILFTNPDMNLPAFTGFFSERGLIFPTLFVTVACGAVSGVHAIYGPGSTSKQIKKESDILPIAYGSMLIEVLMAVIALIAVGAISFGGIIPSGTPQLIFSSAIAGFLTKMGMPYDLTFSIISLAVSAFALTTLDSTVRVGRIAWQELFFDGEIDEDNVPHWKRGLTNKFVAAGIILLPSYILSLSGYQQIWALFGSANQLLAALSLCGVALFLKKLEKPRKIVVIPLIFMFLVSYAAILQLIIRNFIRFGQIPGLSKSGQVAQIILAFLLLILGITLSVSTAKKLRKMDKDKE